jgi:RND superfamily putative drug exporter
MVHPLELPRCRELALAIATQGIALLSHAVDVASVATEVAILIGLGIGVEIRAVHRQSISDRAQRRTVIRRRRRPGGEHLATHRPVRRDHGLHCPARPLRPRRHLPLRPVRPLGHRCRVHHGHLPRIPARNAQVPRYQGPCPRGTGDSGPRPDTFELHRLRLRWANVVEARKKLVAIAALGIVVVAALPIFGLRLGSSDASTDPRRRGRRSPAAPGRGSPRWSPTSTCWRRI